MILWKSANDDPIVARVAIAGDFLPAGNLMIPAGCSWRELAHQLESHFLDVSTSIVNLECALDVDGLAPRPLSGIGQIVSAPAGCLDYLRAIHSRTVGLANNHSCDFGPAGVATTRAVILQHGIAPLGAGHGLNEPPEVFVWRGPGELRVGFWAAARVTSEASTRRSPGVEPAILARASQALERMKKQGARFCVALLHIGCLRTNRPDPEDVALMDLIAKSGFDVAAASHSHRIAGYKQIERVQSGPSFCFYGLGSIVSGYVANLLEREGLIIVAGLNRNGEAESIEVRPLLLDDNGFGKIPTPEMGRMVLRRFRSLSEEILDGSFAHHFYHDVSNGLLRLYLRDVRAAYHAAGFSGLARKVTRLRLRHVRRVVHGVMG